MILDIGAGNGMGRVEPGCPTHSGWPGGSDAYDPRGLLPNVNKGKQVS